LVPFAVDVSADSLDWQAAQQGWSGGVQRISLLGDIDVATEAAKAAQFVVTLGKSAISVNSALPFNQFQADLVERLSASGAWRLVPIPVVGDR
jgi:hypothetical protein